MSFGRRHLGLPLLACGLLLSPTALAKPSACSPAASPVARISLLPAGMGVDELRRTTLLFTPLHPEVALLLRDGAVPPGVPPPLAFTPINAADDRFEEIRQQDRLLLFRQPPSGGELATGMLLFSAVNLAAGHAPQPVRLFLDGPVYIGTIVFREGGGGIGLGGHTR